MVVKRLEVKNEAGVNQVIWVHPRKDGNGEVVSGALHCEEETLNPITGYMQVERFVYWIKANTVDVVERGIKSTMNAINKGQLVPYRVFSETPLHPTHLPDVNPVTEVPMDRYSQVRLGVPKVALELHRTYIEVPVDSTVNVDDKEPIKVESGAE